MNCGVGEHNPAGGVLLAAGYSRRMGRDKALLMVRGRTLLVAMTEALASCDLQPLLVITRTDLAGVVRRLVGGLATVLINPHPEQGQISSLRLALAATQQAPGIVVALVDQGALQVATIQAVARRLLQGDKRMVVASRRGRTGHPIGLARSLFPSILGPACDGGLHDLLEQQVHAQSLALVEMNDTATLANLNTPRDYQRFLDRQCGSFR